MTDITGIGAFGPAADKLAKIVHDFVHPYSTRSQASADAYAIVTKAAAEATADDIRQRTKVRLEWQENQRQENIESITREAAGYLPETASGTLPEADWVSRFFDDSKDVSDSEMRRIWAQILAAETVRPGSFSKRTLSVVKQLSRTEAEFFASIAPFFLGYGPLVIFIKSDKVKQILINAGLHDVNIAKLRTAGLIESTDLMIGMSNQEHRFQFRANDEIILAKLDAVTTSGRLPVFKMPVSIITLSEAGGELASFVRAPLNLEYREALFGENGIFSRFTSQ